MKPGLIIAMFLILGLLAAPALMGANSALAADGTFNASYEAQFGIYPDEICWKLVSRNGSSSFVNGVLIIDSATNPTNWEYYLIDNSVSETLVSPTSGNPWVIEVSAKYISGGTNHYARTATNVGFIAFNDWGNVFFIGNDELFILDSLTVRGATAYRDTNDSFHTYTIKVYADKSIEVYYDDETSPALTGDLMDFSPYNSYPLRIYFGDGNSNAYGVSEWNSVKFNYYNGICGIFLP